jgi:hypothetical protein
MKVTSIDLLQKRFEHVGIVSGLLCVRKSWINAVLIREGWGLKEAGAEARGKLAVITDHNG